MDTSRFFKIFFRGIPVKVITDRKLKICAVHIKITERVRSRAVALQSYFFFPVSRGYTQNVASLKRYIQFYKLLCVHIQKGRIFDNAKRAELYANTACTSPSL